MKPMLQSDLKSLPFLHRGKVRDIYAVGDDKLLVVQTDRLSAFDVILPDPIPEKGAVLTRLSLFWFAKLGHVVANHLTGIAPETVVAPNERGQVEGRAMVVKKLKPLMIEAVVRGYVVGSGWKDYQTTGAICGIKLPVGLKQAERLPEPIFTPATKAESGHDENISFDQMIEVTGVKLAEELRRQSLDVYRRGSEWAKSRGIILADTKFEWGRLPDKSLILIDEVLTPDSSRFWPMESYKPGTSPPSYDKQFVRDWLDRSGWDKNSPPPELPAEVVEKTRQKYLEAHAKLTSR